MRSDGCDDRGYERSGIFCTSDAGITDRGMCIPCYLDLYHLPGKSYAEYVVCFLSDFMGIDIYSAYDLFPVCLSQTEKTEFRSVIGISFEIPFLYNRKVLLVFMKTEIA